MGDSLPAADRFATALMIPCKSEMRRYPIGLRVNSVTNEGPEVSAPAELPSVTGLLFG